MCNVPEIDANLDVDVDAIGRHRKYGYPDTDRSINRDRGPRVIEAT